MCLCQPVSRWCFLAVVALSCQNFISLHLTALLFTLLHLTRIFVRGTGPPGAPGAPGENFVLCVLRGPAYMQIVCLCQAMLVLSGCCSGLPLDLTPPHSSALRFKLFYCTCTGAPGAPGPPGALFSRAAHTCRLCVYASLSVVGASWLLLWLAAPSHTTSPHCSAALHFFLQALLGHPELLLPLLVLLVGI